MAEDGTCKKMASLIQKKDGANVSLTALMKEAEDANSKVSGSAETVLDALHLRNLHSILVSRD